MTSKKYERIESAIPVSPAEPLFQSTSTKSPWPTSTLTALSRAAILGYCMIFILALLVILPSPRPSPLLNTFEIVPGYFHQSNPMTNATTFNVYDPEVSFGLVDRARGWKHFARSIDQLNCAGSRARSRAFYKVVFVARHGQGFHNVGESKYGTKMWDCYWSELNGDGNLTWGPDARLTARGRNEALVAAKAWTREKLNYSIPSPEFLIVSPLSRAIETFEITGLWKSHIAGKRAQIREQWRENIGLHTCDRRRNTSDIRRDFGMVASFEKGFNETDNLWGPIYQETDVQQQARIRTALSQIFNDKSTSKMRFISITAHSGVISALLNVTKHRQYSVQTGGMIPLVIKATHKTPTPTGPPPSGPSATRPVCLT